MSRGIDVHSTRDDHVLLAVNQEQVSILIDVSEITGVQPAGDDRLGSEVRALVVAGHHERASTADFADLAGRQFAAIQLRTISQQSAGPQCAAH
jgi:hypothetical protein